MSFMPWTIFLLQLFRFYFKEFLVYLRSLNNQLNSLTLTLDVDFNHEYSAELNVFINLLGMTAIAYKQ